MKIEKTGIKDCYIIHDTVFEDERGYFFESFNQQTLQTLTGINANFVQDNQSKSNRGVLRGLHFQTGEYAQAKLVRVLQGKVLDVVVDIRKNSPTYGQHLSIELSANSHTQFYVPRGLAHGFSVLEDNTIFFYKCDNFYNKESEGGLMYNDPVLNIDWSLAAHEIILSEKDMSNPLLSELDNNL